MNTEASLRVVYASAVCQVPAQPPRLRAISLPPLVAPIRLALLRSQQDLLNKQTVDGSWPAKRQGNRTLSALSTTCEAITTLSQSGIDSRRPEMIDAKHWIARNAKSLSQNPLGGFQRPGKLEQPSGFGMCSKSLDLASNTELVQLLEAICCYHSNDNDIVDRNLLPPDLRVVCDSENSFGIYLPEDDETTEHVDCFDEVTECCQTKLISRQSADGGWNDAKFFSPESCPQLTSRVLSALQATCETLPSERMDQAIDFLLAAQQPSGSWQAEADGVELIATAQTIITLCELNLATCSEAIAAGLNWLLAKQQEQATATQTAWIILALLATEEPLDQASGRSLRQLLKSQETDGTWHNHPEAIHAATRAMAKFAVELGNTLQSEKHELKLVGV